MPGAVLPIFYYHDHFNEMLAAVRDAYGHIIDASHRTFIDRFFALPRNAQCLYVRMANRRGLVFRLDRVVYPELDVEAGLQDLLARGFAHPVAAEHCEALLASLGKPALFALAQALEFSIIRPSWPKARLLAALVEACGFDQLQRHIDLAGYIVRGQGEALDFLLYLYFGRTHRDLKSFALRDLGLVATNGRDAVSARFTDAAEARACFRYSRLAAALRTPAAYEAACQALITEDRPLSAYAARLRDGLALQVGTYLEKTGDPERAVTVYRLADNADCSERHARLLHALGRVEDCRALLERMIDDPPSDAAYDFASAFHARKFQQQRVGPCTALLRDSQSISIDEAYRGSPEQGAAAWFAREGWMAWWTESGVWLALFGLVFWDELFGEAASLHSGFDRLPRCLADRTFAQAHAATLADCLDRVRSGAALQLVQGAIQDHHGKSVALIGWDESTIEAASALAQYAPPAALAAMLELMCTDFQACSDGFPDLMLLWNGQLRFVEIKAEGDAVRRNQLTRLRQLQRAGFEAGLCRVAYRYDPSQPYVVVDIETTGSRAGIGRVIEVAAVRIQDHRIVAEWHSLVDPGRHVPGFITNLTGISDAILDGAPKFADIAADLLAFMEGCVFAAHSVNFDYGFLASEFRRLGMTLRLPKFCTCAETRRHFPGQASYGLGPLCQAFDIALHNHHRALDDARAAAELLCMINRQRERTGFGGIVTGQADAA